MKHLAVLALVGALVATACSASETDETTTTAPASGAVSSTTTTTTMPPTPTTTTTATTTTTVAADTATDGTQCVVGEWELDADRFFTEGIAADPSAGIDGEIAFAGGAYLLIVSADGTFQAIRDDWSFAVTGEQGELQVIVNDADEGTWSLDGDLLSTVVIGGDPPEITFLVDGEPFTFPGGLTPFEPPEAEFTGATVVCEGDVLAATAEGFTSYWTRNS